MAILENHHVRSSPHSDQTQTEWAFQRAPRALSAAGGAARSRCAGRAGDPTQGGFFLLAPRVGHSG